MLQQAPKVQGFLAEFPNLGEGHQLHLVGLAVLGDVDEDFDLTSDGPAGCFVDLPQGVHREEGGYRVNLVAVDLPVEYLDLVLTYSIFEPRLDRVGCFQGELDARAMSLWAPFDGGSSYL